MSKLKLNIINSKESTLGKTKSQTGVSHEQKRKPKIAIGKEKSKPINMLCIVCIAVGGGNFLDCSAYHNYWAALEVTSNYVYQR